MPWSRPRSAPGTRTGSPTSAASGATGPPARSASARGGRHPVRRLRRRGRPQRAPGAHRLRRARHRRPAGRDDDDHRHLRGRVRAPAGRAGPHRQGDVRAGARAEEPWRFVTSAFAHSPGNLLHIAFNMYALWIMGTYLEPLLGRARFVAVYLLSAIGGSVVYLLFVLAAHRSPSSAAGDGGAVVDRCGRCLRAPSSGCSARSSCCSAASAGRPRACTSSSASTPCSGSSSRGSPGRRTSAASSPERPPPPAIAYTGRRRGPLSSRPNRARALGRAWSASSSCSSCSPSPSTASRALTAHPSRGPGACGLHGCHSSPVGTTPVDNSHRSCTGPSHGCRDRPACRLRGRQRQRVVMRNPDSMRPKPTARFQRPSCGTGYWCTPEM